MKTLYKILFLCILLPFYAKAENGNEKFPHSKEKTITKTYIVNPDATTQISNSYGAISVQLWDENKISITAKITVSGKKESTVNEKIDEVSIDFPNTTVSLISAKTIFPSKKNWGLDWNKSDVSYEVNYVVLIPKRGNVILNNNYGNILISKLNGTSSIKCNYGDIIAGDLMSNNDITINYSDNSKMNYANKLACDANYSRLAVAKGENISTSGNYNKYNFSSIHKVHSTGNYNDYNFKNIDNFNCSGNYVNMNFNNVEASTLSINYGQLNYTATNSFKNATITSNYSSIEINVPAELSFDFDIRCMYGSLKTDLDLNYSLKSVKNNINQYKGSRNISGKSKFTIITNYGSVNLNK